MASVTKRGNSYVIRYTYRDEHGQSRSGWESRKTAKEAKERKLEIETALLQGTFLVPSKMTVRELLDKWIEIQSVKHKWAPKTYESTRGNIDNLINPYIGSLGVQEARPYHFEELFVTLSKTPAYLYRHGVKRTLTERQQQTLLSGTTLHEVHNILRCAYAYAVEWDLVAKNPVPREGPKVDTEERPIWGEDEMAAALRDIEDPLLHLAVHLTVVGSLRAGELLALKPEDLDFDAADGRGAITVSKSLQRVYKDTLARTDPRQILHQFPEQQETSTSVLILKAPKTRRSQRRIFMTAPLRAELQQWLKTLAQQEADANGKYWNSGMLFRLPNGLPIEQTLLRKWFERWQAGHPEYRHIVFHSLRHSSATYQLLISDGDIKSVQGNTGHAQAGILVNTYAHIRDAPRLALTRKFEQDFYGKVDASAPAPATQETPPPKVSGEMLLEALKSADEETKRALAKALFA